LLRYRKKRYGAAFRRVKLITNEKVDKKYQYAIVDPEDYEKLSGYPWQLFESKSKNFYAVRHDGKTIVRMHRVIMNAPKGKIVDHRNRNGLNNTKQNLRFATHSQNCCNSRGPENCSSKYRGVCYHKHIRKWRVEIHYNRIRRHLGYFDNEEDAARAYDEAAKIYHGEFAVLNFPDESNRTLNERRLAPAYNGGFPGRNIVAAMAILGTLLKLTDSQTVDSA
jgi:hypothetical protein